ncbi:MAG TPA: hypothetical protein PK431_16975, partial [Chitinophagales bacterium]|nr:hypothetical protein [Chitinophagales bacterium]
MENHFLQNKGNKDFSMLRPLQRKKVTFVTNSTIMTKTGEITSKAIAARIPMADYIRILKEATESGMSMNDWLLLKIYNEESEVIQELKAEIEKQQKQQQKTENLLAEASGEIANLKKEISKISKEGEQVSKSATKLQS